MSGFGKCLQVTAVPLRVGGLASSRTIAREVSVAVERIVLSEEIGALAAVAAEKYGLVIGA